MHVVILLFFSLSLCFAGTKQDSTLIILKNRFDYFHKTLSSNIPLEDILLDENLNWLENIGSDVDFIEEEELEQKEFYEVLVILGIRHYLRIDKIKDTEPLTMVKTIVNFRQFKAAMNPEKLGPFWIEEDQAFRGLAKAPKVPVFVYGYEDKKWKFNLTKTLSIVSRGLESVRFKKKWSKIKTAIFLLDKTSTTPVSKNILKVP